MTSSSPAYWLVKQEPSEYSWQQFCAEGGTAWTGVRNFQARKFLRSMRVGDLVFFYHSVTEKKIVGLAQVEREAYADPTAQEGDWSCVDLRPLDSLPRAVTLEEIKAEPELAELPLLRQSRLSVMPVTPTQAAALFRLAAMTPPVLGKKK